MPTEVASAGRHLFVFAHPDDEFACLEQLRRSVAEGHEVVCAYLTDGAYGGQAVEPRIEESQRALARQGVAAQSLHFIGAAAGIPDGGLPARMRTAYELLCELVSQQGPVTACFVTAWEGGHQDHDASHAILLAMRRNGHVDAPVWQFPLYNGEGLPGPLFRVMHPLTSNGPTTWLPISVRHRLLDLRTCLGYPSQWRTWLGLLPFVAFKLLFQGSYALQLASDDALEQRPHAGKLLYERRSPVTWEQIRQGYLELLETERPR
ncbi:PIG-L deacetylase family protein [Dyella sp. 2RAB6]|uniref:PIG-L deacetylase family protein n=1 Tax=Dyella sp. 2RAB6 TaxID=3232992 RepID=UPI003F923A65